MKKLTVKISMLLLAFSFYAKAVPERKQLIATYYAIGDYSNATQYLSGLPQTSEELVQFKNYYDLLISLEGVERNIYQLEGEEIGALRDIAATQTSAGLAALAILSLVLDEAYPQVIERVEEEQEEIWAGRKANPENTVSEIEKGINVFPNPANQTIMVNYSVENIIPDDFSVRMIDITGQWIFINKVSKPNGMTEIPTASYSNGVYFIQLYTGGRMIAARKIIVNH